MVDKQRKEKKVAIVGTARSRTEAPYDDESWDIWGLSQCIDLARVTMWWEVHNLERKKRKDPAYMAQLKSYDKPVMLTETSPDIPMGRRFPREEIFKQFRTYFCSQVDLMLAYAIYQKYDQIGLWGIDMAQNTEYAHQRPSCEYWVGLAEGRGIKITVPATSPILKSRRVYGIDDATNEFAALHAARDSELKERYERIKGELEQSAAVAQMVAGGVRELEHLISTSDNGQIPVLEARKSEIEDQYNKALNTKRTLENQLHVIIGAQEDMRWHRQQW